MSFRGTKTPTRADITGKAIHQAPQEYRNGAMAYYLDEETKRHFIRLYPNTLNREMMRIFGLSFSTMQRFKREFGLKKNLKIIRRKQAEQTIRICKENGYYASLKGKAPSPQCQAAAKKLHEQGFVPLKVLKAKNPRKYKKVCEQRSIIRKEMLKRERLRVNWGLEQLTNLHVPYMPFGKKRVIFRNSCHQAGYVPGSPYIESERFIIYYTEETVRGARREKNGEKLGFKFEPINNKKQ